MMEGDAVSAFLVLPEDLTDETAVLRGESHRHLTTSFRVRPGETVRVTDGRGTVAAGIVEAVDARTARVRLTARSVRPRGSRPSLVLALAVLKSNRMDWAIQKCTELGADRIVPFVSERSVATRPARTRPSESAGSGSPARRRSSPSARGFPRSRRPRRPDTVIERASRAAAALVFRERTDAPPIALPTLAGDSEVRAIVGPEGGLSESEVARMTAARDRARRARSANPARRDRRDRRPRDPPGPAHAVRAPVLRRTPGTDAVDLDVNESGRESNVHDPATRRIECRSAESVYGVRTDFRDPMEDRNFSRERASRPARRGTSAGTGRTAAPPPPA